MDLEKLTTEQKKYAAFLAGMGLSDEEIKKSIKKAELENEKGD